MMHKRNAIAMKLTKIMKDDNLVSRVCKFLADQRERRANVNEPNWERPFQAKRQKIDGIGPENLKLDVGDKVSIGTSLEPPKSVSSGKVVEKGFKETSGNCKKVKGALASEKHELNARERVNRGRPVEPTEQFGSCKAVAKGIREVSTNCKEVKRASGGEKLKLGAGKKADRGKSLESTKQVSSWKAVPKPTKEAMGNCKEMKAVPGNWKLKLNAREKVDCGASAEPTKRVGSWKAVPKPQKEAMGNCKEMKPAPGNWKLELNAGEKVDRGASTEPFKRAGNCKAFANGTKKASSKCKEVNQAPGNCKGIKSSDGKKLKSPLIQCERAQTPEKPKKAKESPYHGVSYYKRLGTWDVNLWFGGKQYSLGNSASAVEAARVYDKATIQCGRNRKKMNFPAEEYLKSQDEMNSICTGKTDMENFNLYKKHLRANASITTSILMGGDYLGCLKDENGVFEVKFPTMGAPVTCKKTGHAKCRPESIFGGFFDNEREAIRKFNQIAIGKGRTDLVLDETSFFPISTAGGRRLKGCKKKKKALSTQPYSEELPLAKKLKRGETLEPDKSDSLHEAAIILSQIRFQSLQKARQDENNTDLLLTLCDVAFEDKRKSLNE